VNFWTQANLRSAAGGGTWMNRPAEGAAQSRRIEGLSTDSRTIQQGQAFLAIRGETFDGHAYLLDAIEAGASMLIVDNPRAVDDDVMERARDVGILKVADARKALGRLAASYRQTLDGTKVIAVTGSNGKTTTTRLIGAALSARLRGTVSIKSFNNDVGVPLTILSARPGDQYLVCEVGMNAPGEMAPLAKMIEPDVAVITSIGRAHIEGLGSIEAIAREKAALLSYLRPNGVAVVTADTPLLAEYLKPVPNVVTFGRAASADLRLGEVVHTSVPGGGDGLSFTVNDRWTYTIPLIGEHNALNAMAAVAVARRLGLDHDEIAKGLASAAPAEMRLSRRTVDGIDVFNDAYNASPESMAAAIRTFAALTPAAKRRVMILGDMLELGAHGPQAHEEIGRLLCDVCRPDWLVTVGSLALLIADQLTGEGVARSRLQMLSTLDDAQAAKIAEKLQDGDAVLIKGSRRMGLERVVKAIEKRRRSPAAVGH